MGGKVRHQVWQTQIAQGTLGSLTKSHERCAIAGDRIGRSFANVDDRGGIDQVALFREKCSCVGQGFRRKLTDRRNAVLDILHPPQDRREPHDCITNLDRTCVRRRTFAVVKLFKPPWQS